MSDDIVKSITQVLGYTGFTVNVFFDENYNLFSFEVLYT